MLSTQSFVVPQPNWEPGEFRQIARAYGRAIVNSLIKTRAPDASPLAAIAADRHDESMYWAPELGLARLLVERDRVDAAELLAFAYCGFDGETVAGWDFALADPVRLLLHGYLFDLDGLIRVTIDRDTMRVDRADPPLRIDMKRDGGGVTATIADPTGTANARLPHPIGGAALGGRYMFAWHDGDEDEGELADFWPPSASIDTDAGFLEESCAQVAEAMDVIADVAPQFTRWIAESVRGIAASPRAGDDPFTSGSAMYRPGCISLAFPIDVDGLAELLVHEASHQHFNMLSLVAPMSTGSDTAQYYSTLKGRNRDVKTILLTFHAVANMAIFWRLLIERRGSTDRREKGLLTMRNHATSLVAHLEASSGLTTVGREFWTSHLAEMQRIGAI